MIAINLSPEIEKRLDQLEKATGRTKASFLEEAIIEYLEDLEDAHLAEQELNDIREGRSATHPLSEVMKRYGLGN
jgi:RHH-type rel operon transcriptional repressor/antitoxin RelB